MYENFVIALYYVLFFIYICMNNQIIISYATQMLRIFQNLVNQYVKEEKINLNVMRFFLQNWTKESSDLIGYYKNF